MSGFVLALRVCKPTPLAVTPPDPIPGAPRAAVAEG